MARGWYGFFGFQDAAQMNQFLLTNTNSSLAVAHGTDILVMTCTRNGVASFPSGIDTYASKYLNIDPITGDWIVDIQFTATPTVSAGGVGIGIFNAGSTEYVALEYNGTTFTTHGKSNGATWTADGSTFAVANKTWMRVAYTLATTTYAWAYSTDGQTWTNLTTETGKTFTTVLAAMTPLLYWRSGDVNASPFTINVDDFEYMDASQTITRFGNWVMISTPTYKIIQCHFQTLYIASIGVAVYPTNFVSAGQLLGTVGETGYDYTSGRVTVEHAHFEYAANNGSIYANADAINILDPSLMPRTNSTTNCSIALTSGNDPDGNACHIITLTELRVGTNENFDFNSMTFTGNTTSVTMNWNTRAGLNVNNDIPKQAGLYIVPTNMNEASTQYVSAFYFSKATYGNTFVSCTIYDTAGTLLASL